ELIDWLTEADNLTHRVGVSSIDERSADGGPAAGHLFGQRELRGLLQLRLEVGGFRAVAPVEPLRDVHHALEQRRKGSEIVRRARFRERIDPLEGQMWERPVICDGSSLVGPIAPTLEKVRLRSEEHTSE